MKKSILLAVIVFLLTSSSLFAKTIWFKDLTDNNFNSFYNSLTTSLKESKYGNSFIFVNENKQISAKPGDIVLELNGLYYDLAGGGIWTYTVVMCTVSNDYAWNYKDLYNGGGSWQYIIEQANDAKTTIIKFLDKYF